MFQEGRRSERDSFHASPSPDESAATTPFKVDTLVSRANEGLTAGGQTGGRIITSASAVSILDREISSASMSSIYPPTISHFVAHKVKKAAIR